MKYILTNNDSEENSLPCKIEIQVGFSNLKHLEAIVNTLKVEASEKEIKRGKVDISINANNLLIDISADDLVAARSLSNSILRLLKTSTEVVEILENDNV